MCPAVSPTTLPPQAQGAATAVAFVGTETRGEAVAERSHTFGSAEVFRVL